jgi:cytoskeletal protein CcmA (bactofilin family)
MFNKRNEPVEPGGSAETRREPKALRTDPPPPAATRKTGSSVVGPSILVQGDMTGDEDLVIQGRVEGSISLKKNLVTIGKDGRVNATVSAQIIRVEGTVEGELRGREQIIVTRTGSVSGNLVAPRVTLEDGCRFKGSIDMEGSDAGGAGKVTDIMLGAPVADEAGKAS